MKFASSALVLTFILLVAPALAQPPEIRHGSAVLEARGGTSRRLLVVLSDGLAYDHGYERTYGAADARRALIEARRRGRRAGSARAASRRWWRPSAWSPSASRTCAR